jgi:hypothetical protein
MEELMLITPEDAKPKRHLRRTKALHIVFPMPGGGLEAQPQR